MITLLNTSIVTIPGQYQVFDLGQGYGEQAARERARYLARDGFVSYVGHQATANAFAEILGRAVDVNRQQYTQSVGEKALVLKLRGRLPEGTILDRAALEECGYDLWLMERTA